MMPPFRSRTAGRLFLRQGHPLAGKTYGDDISEKGPADTRIMFQNAKGLTHTTGGEDYDNYLNWMATYAVDMFGLAETNSSWQIRHLQADFKGIVNRQFHYTTRR